jgi:hypothetical protein
MRVIQSRAFETTDRNAVLRGVIATMQDLGYSLEKVEASAGTVTAIKLAVLKMTASTYPHGNTQTIVRANALVKVGLRFQQVDAAEFYQKDFFDPLSKAIFLKAEFAAPEDAGNPAVDRSQAAPAPISPTLSNRSTKPTS